MFASSKLKHSILAGYLVPIVVLCVSGAFVYHGSSNVIKAVERSLEASQVVDYSNQVKLSGARLQAISRGLLLKESKEGYDDFEKAQDSLRADLENLKSSIIDNEQMSSYQDVEKILLEMSKVTSSIVSSLQRGDHDTALRLFTNSNSLSLYNQLDTVQEKMFLRGKQIQEGRIATVIDTASRMNKSILIAILLGVTFSVIASLLLTRQITARVVALINTIASSSQEIVASTCNPPLKSE